MLYILVGTFHEIRCIYALDVLLISVPYMYFGIRNDFSLETAELSI